MGLGSGSALGSGLPISGVVAKESLRSANSLAIQLVRSLVRGRVRAKFRVRVRVRVKVGVGVGVRVGFRVRVNLPPMSSLNRPCAMMHPS